MNWTVLLFSFCLAVLTGAIAATTLARMRPHWPERKRLWAAALVLPLMTLVGTLIGMAAVLLSGPGEGENMQDLAIAAIVTVGSGFALLAFAGGFIGAALRQRGMRR